MKKKKPVVEEEEEDYPDEDELDQGEEPLDQDPLIDDMDDGDGAFDDGGFYGDGMSTMEKHSDLLKELTDFDPYLKTAVNGWLGMVWSDKDEKYVRDKKIEPIMNTVGSRWAVNFLMTYTRNNNIITNTDRETYVDIMSDVIEVALLNIGTRAEEFGITSDGDVLLVSTQLIHGASLILIGTGGDKNYADLLQATVHRNENVNMQNQNPQLMNNTLQPIPQKKPTIVEQATNMIMGRKT